MNDYEAKQARKKAYYAEKAQKLRQEAEATHQRASKMASIIPFGQPILVGHHSEKRDRNYRNRIQRLYASSYALSDKADYYEEKSRLKSNAISSDDQDALQKLEQKLKTLEAHQEQMKTINRLYKKEGKNCLYQLSQEERNDILRSFRHAPDGAHKPYPSFCLSNNLQRIRQCKQRIASLQRLEQTPDREPIHGEGFVLKEDKDDHRILFIFESKPCEEIRRILKTHAFKWSPSRGAWVRQLNGNGRFAAKHVTHSLNALNQG